MSYLSFFKKHHVGESMNNEHFSTNLSIQLPPNPGMLNSRSDSDKMFVDVGVYGVPKRPGFDAEKITRNVEEFVR